MPPAEDETDIKPGDTLEWDVDMEVQLFYAMAGLKPVGINKHFNMACIWEKLSNSITKEISTTDIWKHLDTLYDIPMLDETEGLPFPNNEVQFCLPESEFGSLMKLKCKDTILVDDSEVIFSMNVSDPPSPTAVVSTPKSVTKAPSKDNTPKAGSRKASTSSTGTKARKESGSSHASTDTPSNRSEKDYGSRSEKRRDSHDSNTSGTRESSTSRKPQKTKTPKSRTSSGTAEGDDDSGIRRANRRRPNPSTPPTNIPAKRRRT